MNYNLKNYLQVYDNYLDATFCNKIVSASKEVTWDLHRYYTPDGNYVRTDNELSITYDSMKETEELQEAVRHLLIHYYNTFKFPWFSRWSNRSEIRYNKYDQNTSMKLHCDHIHDLFDGEQKGIPILSVVGCLNEDYTGGEFVMWDEVIPVKQGTIMIFPSNFLYPHGVRPVESGTRLSFVQWVW